MNGNWFLLLVIGMVIGVIVVVSEWLSAFGLRF